MYAQLDPQLQVVERWVQAAPMHALLRQPLAASNGAENQAPSAHNDGDDATVDPSSDCIVSAVLEMAFAGVALMLPEPDAKGRRIYSLAYEDPPPHDCIQVLGAIISMMNACAKCIALSCLGYFTVALAGARG